MCIDLFPKFLSVQVNTTTSAISIISFLQNNIALHSFSRNSRTDQGPEFFVIQVEEFSKKLKIRIFIYAQQDTIEEQ